MRWRMNKARPLAKALTPSTVSTDVNENDACYNEVVSGIPFMSFKCGLLCCRSKSNELNNRKNNRHHATMWWCKLAIVSVGFFMAVMVGMIYSSTEDNLPMFSFQKTSNNTITTTTPTTAKARRRPKLPPDGESPHVVFNDLKYRRVCSKVYHSVLCMIVRYPFDVPLQDPTVTYPKPVDPRFYNLTKLELIDWPQWWYNCSEHENDSQNYQSSSSNGAAEPHSSTSPGLRFHTCLEHLASNYSDTTVLALFTRQTYADTPADWYGTGTTYQVERMAKFFSSHLVLVLGASPAPYISFCLSTLFECNYTHSPHNYTCGTTESQTTFLRPFMYYPPLDMDLWLLFYNANLSHTLLDTLLTHLPSIVNNTALHESERQEKHLRPLSLIIDFPIAHTQTFKMMHHSYEQVRYNQVRFVQLLMDIKSPAARLDLANRLGLELTNIIAFDGLPQHFPTDSGAYPDVRQISSEQEFLNNVYEGWRPEWGSVCRGPLPPNSSLTSVNSLERAAFAGTKKLDMDKWYGNVWEFSNQFWWEAQMWNGPGSKLDCTHPKTLYSGATCVHRYFLQAMVDGYYEFEG